MRIRRLFLAMCLAAGLVVVPAGLASADNCSGRSNPNTERGTSSPEVLGWWLQYGSESDPFVGYYYSDGYGYVDASGGKLGFRIFVPWGRGFVDLMVTADPANATVTPCEHVREP